MISYMIYLQDQTSGAKKCGCHRVVKVTAACTQDGEWSEPSRISRYINVVRVTVNKIASVMFATAAHSRS